MGISLKDQAEYAEKIIATWPEWKKGLLDRFAQPTSETPRPFVYNHSVLCSGDRRMPVGSPGCCCLRMLTMGSEE